MGDLRQDAELALQVVQVLRVRSVKHLERDVRVALVVDGFVDDAVPARAELANDEKPLGPEEFR